MTTTQGDPYGRFDSGFSEKRQQRNALDWRFDPLMERLLASRDAGESRWDDLSSSTKISAGMYAEQRKLAAEHGIDVTRPSDNEGTPS